MKRRIQKPIHETFNDGYITIGETKIERNDRGKRIGEQFTAVVDLAFTIKNAREEDYELAHTLGASLDLKIKTRFPPDFQTIRKSKFSGYIEDQFFDVIKVDWDSSKRYLYLYLQEVKSDE